MIAGELTIYKDGNDDPTFSQDVLIECTDWSETFVEISTSAGKQRLFLKFRLSDLIREVKELQG